MRGEMFDLLDPRHNSVMVPALPLQNYDEPNAETPSTSGGPTGRFLRDTDSLLPIEGWRVSD